MNMEITSQHASQKSKSHAIQDIQQIERVISIYLDGFINHDPDFIRKSFHPSADLKSIDDGNVNIFPVSEWISKIEERKNQGTKPLVASPKIIDIAITQDAATAVVSIQLESYKFIDYLSLLKESHGWMIVHKIYTVIH